MEPTRNSPTLRNARGKRKKKYWREIDEGQPGFQIKKNGLPRIGGSQKGGLIRQIAQYYLPPGSEKKKNLGKEPPGEIKAGQTPTSESIVTNNLSGNQNEFRSKKDQSGK